MKKKNIISMSIILLVVFIALTGCAIDTTGLIEGSEDLGESTFSTDVDNTEILSITECTDLTAVEIGEENIKTLTGRNGSILLVDSISNSEYTEMMKDLYPNGILDEQGMDIPGIENLEEVRAEFIAQHTKAYSVNGLELKELSLNPFELEMFDAIENTSYNALFYQASIGDDRFIFPSEWGNPSGGFLTVSEEDVYLVWNATGIWKVDPYMLKTDKLSSDTFNGKEPSEIIEENPDLYSLLWIDGVQVSPDGNFVVFRTNRDCIEATAGETSVWAIDLQTGEERQIIKPTVDNGIVGFLSDTQVVVGHRAEIRAVDLISDAIIPLSFPEMPHFNIDGVYNGIIIYSTYSDDSDATFINRIDTKTGKLDPVVELTDCRREPQFSPSGKDVAIGYSPEPNKDVIDAVIINTGNGDQTLLSRLLRDNVKIDGSIRRVCWVNDSTFLLFSRAGSESKCYLVSVE